MIVKISLKKIFLNFSEIRKTCNQENKFVFVICDNIVCIKKDNIETCLKNINYCEKSTTYVIDNCDLKKKYLFLSNNDRINLYCKGILHLEKYQFNKGNRYYKDKQMLKNFLENSKNKEKWIYQHNKNFQDFIKREDLEKFYLNPYDLNWSLEYPAFVKSRQLTNPLKSVLLPLENLYQPSFYANILQEDIPYNKKISNVVWRGSNSGYVLEDTEKASRFKLVEKYRFHKKFNIGFSSIQYNKKLDLKKYLADKLSIKDQLKYKFIISVEGNDFATNLSWIMLSNSVPILPKCFVETWKCESAMTEYIHYIPVKRDFTDLQDKIEWALENDEKCLSIAFMSRMFILQFFDVRKEKFLINKVIKKYKHIQ